MNTNGLQAKLYESAVKMPESRSESHLEGDVENHDHLLSSSPRVVRCVEGSHRPGLETVVITVQDANLTKGCQRHP